MSKFQVGDSVEWDTWAGVAAATVVHVNGSSHITLSHGDGHSSMVAASCFRTLAEATAHLRIVDQLDIAVAAAVLLSSAGLVAAARKSVELAS